MEYLQKIIITKNEIKTITYSKPIVSKDFKRDFKEENKKNNNEKVKTLKEIKQKRYNNAKISKEKIEYLIKNNVVPNSKFLTLTYKENVGFEEKEKTKQLNLFITKLKYYYPGIKYIWVRELQKRGSIHYHFILFYSPKIDLKILSNCWRYGFIKINAIKDINAIIKYSLKYITKSIFSDIKDIDSIICKPKKFGYSNNLEKPLIVKSFDRLDIYTNSNFKYQTLNNYMYIISEQYNDNIIYDDNLLTINKLYNIFGDKLEII